MRKIKPSDARKRSCCVYCVLMILYLTLSLLSGAWCKQCPDIRSPRIKVPLLISLILHRGFPMMHHSCQSSSTAPSLFQSGLNPLFHKYFPPQALFFTEHSVVYDWTRSSVLFGITARGYTIVDGIWGFVNAAGFAAARRCLWFLVLHSVHIV